MKLSEYAKYDAVGLAALLSKGEVTARELASLVLEGVDRLNPQLNAVIETFPQRVTADYLAALPNGALRGVPFLNKDLSFPEKGSMIEMGSQLMKGHIADYDCLAIERLRKAGLVNLGRTTTPEFGLVGVTESRISGITRNPWDLSRTPSGSSGGSAAAISSGMVPIATGSDGGGSIRGPAANCGLVGLKPTRDRVTLGPYCSDSLCGLGVIFGLTKSVRDTATLLDILQGPSLSDTFGPLPPIRPYTKELEAPLEQLRVAYAKSFWGHEKLPADISDSIDIVVHLLEDEGHIVEEIHPAIDYEIFLDATLKVWSADLATGLMKISADTGQILNADILQSSTLAMYQYGHALSATELLAALDYFAEVSRSVAEFFTRYDLLITPSSASSAREIGAFQCDRDAIDLQDWNREIYFYDGYYPLYNTTGNPAISLPLHQSRENLPIGVQFAASLGNEALLIRTANFFEQALPWSERLPKVHVSKI